MIILIVPVATFTSEIPSSSIPGRYDRYEQQRQENRARIAALQAKNSPKKSSQQQHVPTSILKVHTSTSSLSNDDLRASQNEDIMESVLKYNALARVNRKIRETAVDSAQSQIQVQSNNNNQASTLDLENLTLEQMRGMTIHKSGLNTGTPTCFISCQTSSRRYPQPVTQEELDSFAAMSSASPQKISPTRITHAFSPDVRNDQAEAFGNK